MTNHEHKYKIVKDNEYNVLCEICGKRIKDGYVYSKPQRNIKKECPICRNNTIKKIPSIKRWVNFIVFIMFRPAWIITLIYSYAVKKYKCGVCGKVFNKNVIDNL